MARSGSTSETVILIPGTSLAGRNLSFLEKEKLRFWFRCRGDSLKGLKTEALLVKRENRVIP